MIWMMTVMVMVIAMVMMRVLPQRRSMCCVWKKEETKK